MPPEILVVEDSPTQSESLRALLARHGFAVTIAPSAEEAMAVLRRRDFDLVLSDVMMPGADGYELTRHVKQELQRPDLPVILLTTRGEPLDIVRGLAAGADNYVTKPYESDLLLSRVRHMLAARERRRATKAALGVQVEFFGAQFTITSEKEQILELLLSSVEDTVRANRALQESQQRLAEAHRELREHADRMHRKAVVSTGRYQALMQHVWAPIFVLDGAGRILETNDRGTRVLTELSPLPSAEGQPLARLVAPGARARLEAALKRLPETLNALVPDLPIGDDVRPQAYWELSLAVAPGDGEALVLAVVHDTTERRESERRLRESDARARAILDSLTEGVVLVTCDGTVRWCNRSAAGFLDGAPRPASGQSVAELGVELIAEDGVPLTRDAYPSTIALREGRAPSRLLGIRAPGRPLRWCLASAQALVPSDGGAPYAAVTSLIDVTQRRQEREQLRQSQRLEAVGRLAGGVAHDFNNVLTVIRSYCDMILAGVDSASELRNDVSEISAAADRAAILTRQLLTFGRRRMTLPQPLSLNDAITGVAPMLRRLLRENTELSLALAPALPSVVVDPGQVDQILMNLVLNARDAMPDGGRIAIATRAVHLGAADVAGLGDIPPGDYALLAVSDTGVGMPPEVRERIFEPFFTTKALGTGTGLGLATVYGIVREAAGQIVVDSEPGRGTTFEIHLPLSDARPVPPAAPAAVPARAGAGGKTILVADDDDAVRRVIVLDLRRLGHEVLEARSGDEALALVRARRAPIDVLLTDMVMPGMHGRALAEATRQLHPETRMLYTSGYSAELLTADDVRQPGVAFLEKPFSASELARELRALLDTGATSSAEPDR